MVTKQHLAFFSCPRCHAHLFDSPVALICSDCGKAYPLVDGIACFDDRDAFYEGKWARPDLSAGSLRNRLVKKERFFIDGLRGRKGSILDLGCGGGWRFFSTLGYSVGIDVSLGSVRSAKALYDQVAQAQLSELPFADGSFDFVVSSDVLGHVPLAEKDAVLHEILRVLKPGGLTMHYVEADGEDPLMRFAKAYPDLYSRHIVKPEGHIGLESTRAIAARFERAGFRVTDELACYRALTYVRRFVQYFDNEYKGRSSLIRLLVWACRLATIAAPVELAANVGMTFLIELGDRALPEHWAGGLLICCEKS